jgi:hypothetical protein
VINIARRIPASASEPPTAVAIAEAPDDSAVPDELSTDTEASEADSPAGFDPVAIARLQAALSLLAPSLPMELSARAKERLPGNDEPPPRRSPVLEALDVLASRVRPPGRVEPASGPSEPPALRTLQIRVLGPESAARAGDNHVTLRVRVVSGGADTGQTLAREQTLATTSSDFGLLALGLVSFRLAGWRARGRRRRSALPPARG